MGFCHAPGDFLSKGCQAHIFCGPQRLSVEGVQFSRPLSLCVEEAEHSEDMHVQTASREAEEEEEEEEESGGRDGVEGDCALESSAGAFHGRGWTCRLRPLIR